MRVMKGATDAAPSRLQIFRRLAFGDAFEIKRLYLGTNARGTRVVDKAGHLYYYSHYSVERRRREMMQFRTIEIDFDVHRAIENARRGFHDSANDALRRLLKLPEPDGSPGPADATPQVKRPWRDDGVDLPHGTAVRMEYNRRIHEGQIVDGQWVVEGRRFDSPSGAASGVAVTKKGKSPRLDGWKYWRVKRPGEDHWEPLDDLRPKGRIILNGDGDGTVEF
jgi:hypothetical protein